MGRCVRNVQRSASPAQKVAFVIHVRVRVFSVDIVNKTAATIVWTRNVTISQASVSRVAIWDITVNYAITNAVKHVRQKIAIKVAAQ